jgi:hypothetical protein
LAHIAEAKRRLAGTAETSTQDVAQELVRVDWPALAVRIRLIRETQAHVP